MGREYDMLITVTGHDLEKDPDVRDAILGMWTIDGYSRSPDEGETNLVAWDMLGRIATDVANAVFKANGKKCHVEVVATFLDDLPYETYTFGPDDDGA